MKNKDYISDELLAAYLDGNVSKKEMEQVLQAVGTDSELQEVLDVALRLDEDEQSVIQIAAEGGRNLCDVRCEAYVLKQFGFSIDENELLEIAKENHWIKKAGTPLQFMGNILEHEGLKVRRKYKASIEEIENVINKGGKAIVAVDSDKLYPERPDEEDATNHAIVVININHESVTIYDPGDDTIAEIKRLLFLSAWRESRYYLVDVQKE